MKKIKNNKAASQVSKISDFFSKSCDPKPVKHDTTTNKRKNCDVSQLEKKSFLNNGISVSKKISPRGSPTRKKVKQDENCVPSVSTTSIKPDPDSFKIETPEKLIKPSTSMKTPNSQKTSGSGKNRTPQSVKKGTPKKLFEKSPSKLGEFNVKLLENFMNISPSKSNRMIKVQVTPSKINSIAMLSKPANRSSSQYSNETTPSKQTKSPSFRSPRTRMKLSFLDSFDVDEKEKMDHNLVTDLKQECSEFLDDEFDIFISSMEEYNLDLKEPKHCTVMEVKKSRGIFTLKLKSKDEQKGFCNIEDFWASGGNFDVGSSVYLTAAKIKNEWVINNEHGWLIYEPDLLIPCTSVVGSIFCKRKAVLSDRYRSIDSTNRVMLIGILTHTLLQQALKNKLKTDAQIRALMNSILKSRDTAKRLYENDLSVEEIKTEIEVFVPKLVQFISEYLNRDSAPHLQNWQGKICDINDIEENFWCPDLGIKGKIDVTVRTDSGVVPLELKTGRATVSLEHRGQVVMYIMMMNKFGYKVSSGLLLYLKEGVLKEIKATAQEKRDVMILRNELAYFLTRNTVNNENIDFKKAPEMPEPLVNHRACNNCPYNIVCTSLLKYENWDISRNEKIQDVQKTATSHLTEKHLDYFVTWTNYLDLENASSGISKSIKHIYTKSPAQREAAGKCIVNLKLSKVGDNQNGLYEHKFIKNQPNFNFLSSHLLENSYIIVSTNCRPAVASGYVTSISHNHITIALDRNLNKNHSGQLFHLDTYESNVVYTFNMSCLSLLLENTSRAAELRNIIIDKKPPTFLSKLPSVVAKKGAVILKRLNAVQQRAVLKALSAEDFILIKGMPGTGKSATIVALIQLLVELDKTVLITSHTHSAIDNICLRLQKRDVEFLRLGSESKLDPNLRSLSEATILQNCTTPEEIEEAYNQYKVIAVTCLGSGHPLLSKRTVDVCIVDESTQVLQTSVIRTLYAAKMFVLIGDPDQLAPVVRNRKASEAGMSETLFERLNYSSGTIALNLNYRMNQTITDLANVLTYKGELKTANEIVANRVLEIPNFKVIEQNYREYPWLFKALDTSLELAVQIIDTGPAWQAPCNVKWHLEALKVVEGHASSNYINVREVAIVVTIVRALILGGVSSNDIGVIATYTAQVFQISKFLEILKVDVSTVDQFQGRDKNVIIFSCTKSINPEKRSSDKNELLEDKRRLTVAVTRAKRKLLIVGDVSTLKLYSTFSKILPELKNKIIKFESSWDFVRNL